MITEPEGWSEAPTVVEELEPDLDLDLHENENEDEDDEQPDFSLVDALVAHEPPRGPALQIIGWVGEEIRTTEVLGQRGARFFLRANDPFSLPGFELAELWGPGEAIINIPDGIQAQVSGHGELVSGRYHLRDAMVLIERGDHGLCLRFVSPAALPPEQKDRSSDTPARSAFGSAIALHIFVGAIIGVASAGFRYEEPREQWARLEQTDLRNVEARLPEPAPQPEEPVAEVNDPPVEQPREAPPTKRERNKSKRAPASSGPDAAERAQTKGVLSALGSLAPPGKKSLVVAASNLSAVRVPGGGGFRVGALIAKSPTSGVQVGGGGGGKLLTRGTASLLKDGYLVAGLSKKAGNVRGGVERASRRMIKTQGNISREEVARVINEHLRDVQQCYEKALIGNAGLEGKLVIEWSIDQAGSVGQVRQKMSSLPATTVFECISARLKTWRFPKPQGGDVIVSYPFIFNSVGF